MDQGPGDSSNRQSALRNARRDAIVLCVLVAAVGLLLWNSSSLLRELRFEGTQFGRGAQIASTALLLNLALILFGWRRYIDLRQEGERRREGERRAQLAERTDAQSGLLNRRGFADAVDALRQAPVESTEITFLSLQIDRWKSVIDRHGYDVGDALLRHLAEGLSQAVGEDGIVARLSGDEFAIAIPGAAGAEQEAEERARAALVAMSRPCDADGRVVHVGAFAGLASAPLADLHLPSLLRRADIAMGHARASRSARPVWFDSAMEQALHSHIETEQQIRSGLELGQFQPYFEPQIDLRTHDIVGFEMLVRWDHPLRGIVGPSAFLPIAEEMGLMNRLSETVIRSAMIAAREWDPTLSLAVNIAPTQLSDGWLAERILRMLVETGFPADRLVIEITETSLFADIDIARSLIASLKNQGVRIALDDFGTGFSSLSYLRSLPFDLIKIDRSFVSNIHRSHESEAIVRAVVALADGLKVPVLVEGIECANSLARVSALGCPLGQGWYFGKAISAEEASAMLAERDRPTSKKTARN